MLRRIGVPLRALSVFLCLLTAGAARAATYYVATTGNDANPGSQAAPWRTLQKAGNVAAAGDTVHVLPGTYAGFRPLRSGSAQAPIRFLAQAGVVVNTPGSGNSNGDDIWIRNVDHIVIDGFECTAAPRAGIAVQGEPDANATGVVIRNCHCHHNGRWGIFTGFARDLLLEDNETSYSAIEHGIYVSNSGDRPTVRRNHAHHNNASGIQLNADPAQMGSNPADPQGDGIIENALIEANLIHDNGAAGGAAINLASVRGALIRNNLLYGNRATGIAGWDDGEGSNRYGCRDNVIVGNTIVQPSGSRFAIGLLNGSTGNSIRDNILLHLGTRGSVSADPSSQVGLVSDYNVVVDRFSNDDVFYTLAQWRGFGFDAHSFIASAAALFVDAANDDYHLSATSPARDAGIAHPDLPLDRDGVARPQGAAVDIGAYERVVAGSPSPSPTATGTPAPPPTTTPTGGLQLAGTLLARGGVPVPSATLTLAGAGAHGAGSAANGSYGFAGVAPGVWTLTPRKSGDLRGAVSALDAAWALQSVAQLRTLTASERLAADVTGDGTVSALDATLILQRAVGLIAAFPAAAACGSDWLFVPYAAAVPNQSVVPPLVTGGGCTMGSLTYGPLTADASGQSFTAIPLGDVTGNWQ
ncbi:right-handed parallel beta-helix repeat-containing protein [bacterium]|nr:right-handed parallel beta-helix repeat-containing protein [bacterium]